MSVYDIVVDANHFLDKVPMCFAGPENGHLWLAPCIDGSPPNACLTAAGIVPCATATTPGTNPGTTPGPPMFPACLGVTYARQKTGDLIDAQVQLLGSCDPSPKPTA